MYRSLSIWFLLLCVTAGYGQTIFQPKLDINGSKGVVYDHENTIDLRPHTYGMTLGVQLGKIRTYYKAHFTYYSIGIVKDPREKSQSRYPRQFLRVQSKPFRFGKNNHVINLRAGRGVRRLRSSESKRRGVSVGYAYQGGLSLAILNPVYLNLVYPDEEVPARITLKKERYSKENADRFTDRNTIYGGTSYFTGFKDLAIRPGIQGSLGAVFSFGNFDKYIKILEVGIMADVFIGKLPIMIETEAISNKPYLLNFYASLQFGKRK